MKGLALTQKEQARLQVLNGILEGQISVDEAAEVLGVSERHVWRILAELSTKEDRMPTFDQVPLQEVMLKTATGKTAQITQEYLGLHRAADRGPGWETPTRRE